MTSQSPGTEPGFADTGSIREYHAHVYYDETSRPVAAQLRDAIEERFDIRMGRWRDKPVGPHPMFSYQVAFKPAQFGEIVPWLALNRQGLTVFVHPETGDDLTDHTAHVMWLGPSVELNTGFFED